MDSSTNQNTTELTLPGNGRSVPQAQAVDPQRVRTGTASQVERGSRQMYRALRATMRRKTPNRVHGLKIFFYADT